MRRLAALFAAVAVLAVAATPAAATPSGHVGYPGVWQAIDCAQWYADGPLDTQCGVWGDGSKVRLTIGRTATPVVTVNDDYAADCALYTTSTHWTAEGTGACEDGTLWVNLLRGRCGAYQPHPDNWGWGLYWDPGSDTLWLDEGGGYGLHFWRVAG